MERIHLGIVCSVLLALSCGGSRGEPASAAGGERGRQALELDGDPNGLWWDDAAQTLYVADDNGNRILTWTDERGFASWRELPAASPGTGLGQLAFTADGTLVATRFGHGTAGQVLFVPPSGEAQNVPGLDPARRRIGLTVAQDGRLFDCWFVKSEQGRTGGVSELSLSGSETDVIVGLKKPVGVLASGDRLFVSDQDRGEILAAPLADLASHTVFASFPGPDLLASGPAGSLLSGSKSGSLYQVSAEGAASVLESDFDQVRGVAYDPTNRRVFVAEHDADGEDGVRHRLHVLPLPLPLP